MKRLTSLIFSMLLLASPSWAFDINAMSDAERAAFGTEIRAYLIENPGVVMEALAAIEQAQATAQIEADKQLVNVNASEIFNDGFSWVGGNPDGDITLVEFLDYRCGYCRRAHGEVAQLLENDGNIRIIIKEFPILGEESLLASRFAIAAKNAVGDSEYKLISDALMTFNGDIDMTSLRRLSDALGLQTDVIVAAMDSETVTREIASTRDLAQRMLINGTPTFVMQDELLRGYLPLEQMQALAAEIRTR
jgi:protein-disulfide isomerase